jgi:hypothetical protein
MAKGVRDGKISFSSMRNNLQTVCEQSASLLGAPQRVHQFVNKVHQVVTIGTLQTVS